MLHSLTPIVFVVDNNVATRQSLELLIRGAGGQPETFASAHEFLARPRPRVPSCLIANVSLPDLDGLQLQERMAAERREMPMIFLSERGDVRMAVKAMKGGALEFLTKPFDDAVMLNAILQAVRRSEATLGREYELQLLRADFGSLTRREREVMTLVVSGLLNKQVGGELGISEITVKAHRGNVMKKMKAGSFAHLVNIADRLRISSPQAARAVLA